MIRLAVILLVLRMCGDDDSGLPHDRADAGFSPEAGTDAGAGFADGGVAPPVSMGFPLDPSTGAESPGERDDEGAATLDSCYDGLDNDAASSPGADCDDPGCATLASCWIGRDVGCGPATPGPSFVGCGGDSCFAGAALFGSPTPFVEGDMLALGGDATYDSGLLFASPYDLRTDNLRLVASFGLPAECEGCLESAAFGVTAASALGDTDHVVPIAALVLSGARDDVSLVVGNATIARFDASPGPWTLELSPTGTARVRREGVIVHEGARFARDAAARVVLYGHSRNPSATAIASARIEQLTTTSERCDMPAAWSAPEALVFERGVERWTVQGATSPSVALDAAGLPTLAFVARDAVFVAKAPDPAAPARFVPTANDGLDGPGVLAGMLSEVREVELVSNAGGLTLFVLGGELGTTLARHELAGDARSVGVGTTLSVPGIPIEGFGVVVVDGKTFLVARHEHELRAHVSFDGTNFSPVATLPLAGIDADAFGSPDLFVQRDTYRVSLPVRRGTRWRSALFASDDFVNWRLIDDEVATGMDQAERLGVRSADALVEDGRESWFYEGDDGVGTTLRRRARLTP